MPISGGFAACINAPRDQVARRGAATSLGALADLTIEETPVEEIVRGTSRPRAGSGAVRLRYLWRMTP